MVKKVVQDINVKKPKLLKFEEAQDVAAISSDEPVKEKIKKPVSRTPRKRYISSTPVEKKKSFPPKWSLYALICIVACILVYISYTFFQKVDIDINTRKQNFEFKNELFTAYKDYGKNPHFEIMILDDVYTKKINFSEFKDLNEKAHGVVTIQNEYSTKPQKINAKTKLVDDYGRVYTTDTTVIVPGMTKTKDKTKPGSVAVKITAIGAGDEYNTNSKNFLIQSFEKTDKYTKIYATATNPMSGGALGKFYSLGPVELGTISAEANTVFKDQIMRKLSAQIPTGYILYPGATNFSYNFDQNTKSKDPLGSVEISGSMSALIFKIDDLKDVFVKKAAPLVPADQYPYISVSDMSKFSLKLEDKNKVISKDLNEISFTLDGGSTLVWTPDISNVKESVLGVRVSDLSNILQKNPSILNSHAKFLLPFQKIIPAKEHMVNVKLY